MRQGKAAAADGNNEHETIRRELAEAHEYQAAASEVLSIISCSPKDAQPVFDAIVESVARLCGSIFSIIQLCDGKRLKLVAANNFAPEALKLTPLMTALNRSHLIGRAIVDARNAAPGISDETAAQVTHGACRRGFAIAGSDRVVDLPLELGEAGEWCRPHGGEYEFASLDYGQ